MLSIAARHADIVGVNPHDLRAGRIGAATTAGALASAVDRKIAWVRQAAGDRIEQIELNQLCFAATITDDLDPYVEFLARLFGTPADEVLGSPTVVAGSPSPRSSTAWKPDGTAGGSATTCSRAARPGHGPGRGRAERAR